MMKKTIFFMLCMSPLAVNAEIIKIPENDMFGAGPTYTMDGLAATDDTYVFTSGTSIQAGSGGITATGDFYVGRDSSDPVTGGYIYLTSGVSDLFNVRSDGDISIGGSLVLDTGLYIGETTGGGDAISLVSIGGNITANAEFSIDGTDKLSVDGAISSTVDLDIDVGQLTVGGALTLGGTSVINASTGMDVGGITATGDNESTTIIVGTPGNGADLTVFNPDADVDTGNIQNLAGTMTINTNGGSISANSIENSGTAMNITAGDVTVAGTMKNDTAGTDLSLTLNSLTISGKDPKKGASLVLAGDFYAYITGATHLEYGFTWGDDTNYNREFVLHTGSLSFGDDAGDAWTRVFTNDLNKFELVVSSGGIDVPVIFNGQNNDMANMTIVAQTINADSVTNAGNLLDISTSAANGGNIVIGPDDVSDNPDTVLTGESGSTTNVVSNQTLDINGSVSNSGNMTLNGGVVNIVSVSNTNNGDLDIVAPTNKTGQINISGNVTNESGTTDINGKNLSIDGILTNTSGTTTIQASDKDNGSLTIGTIFANGGTLNLNALIGSVNVTNGITIADNALLNLGTATNKLVAGGTISIAGNFTMGDTVPGWFHGDMNVSAIANGFVLQSGGAGTAGTISIGGGVNLTSGVPVTFDATNITIGTSVSANGTGTRLNFGTDQTFDVATAGSLAVTGAMTVGDGAIIDIYSGTTSVANLDVDGKLIVHGNTLTTKNGTIDIDGGIYFDGTSTTQNIAGMIVDDTTEFTLATQSPTSGEITIGGPVKISNGNSLTLDAEQFVEISGDVSALGNLDILANGYVNVGGGVVSAADFTIGGQSTNVTKIDFTGNWTNAGTAQLNAINSVNLASVTNNVGGDLSVAAAEIGTGAITNNANMALDATGNIQIDGIIANKAGELTIDAKNINAGAVTNAAILNAVAHSGEIVLGAINNQSGATLTIGDATTTVIQTGGITNAANASAALLASGNITVGGNIINNGTTLGITSSNGNVQMGAVTANAGTVAITGQEITLGGALTIAKGAATNIDSADITINGAVDVTGDVIQGAGADASPVGALNLVQSDIDASMTSLVASGNFIANANTTGVYTIANNAGFAGMNINDGAHVTMNTKTGGVDITNGLSVGVGSTLDMKIGADFSVQAFDVAANAVVNMNVATDATMAALTTGNASQFTMDIGGSATMADVTVGDASQFNMDIGGATEMSDLSVSAGADATIASVGAAEMMNLDVVGNLKFTGTGGVTIGGNVTNAGIATVNGAYVDVTGTVTNSDIGSVLTFNADNGITLTSVTNNGTLIFKSVGDNGITLNEFTNNGNLTLDSGAGITTMYTAFNPGMNGIVTLDGAGLSTFTANVAQPTYASFTLGSMLYQNQLDNLLVKGDVNITSDNYAISAADFTSRGIQQIYGQMVINASTIDIDGNVSAYSVMNSDSDVYQGIIFAANPATKWMTVDIDGFVSGGVDFIGLKDMNITGDYTFDNNSRISAAILQRPDDTSTPSYWATVSLADDETLGQITNAENAEALITVGGEFISDVTGFGLPSVETPLKNGQMGITLFDTVDQGSAIWLVHADEGIRELSNKIRNLNVNFCNADGTMCINYLDTLNKYPGMSDMNVSDTDLPVYLSVRDTDEDGIADSLYIVFDPRFGGPVEVFKIQPIVERADPHTTGEYVSAGAIDDMIEGQLMATKWYSGTAIELIPEIFKNTNMEEMANELYDRMEYYNMDRDGDPLARFSRLFQVRELEQIAGSVALNEHTNFRSFEDRMLDEFIWNRNRSLKKAWADVEYGLFSQDVSDGKRVYGDRFSVSAGFDWQDSETLILGLTARASNMSSDNTDTVDLSYSTIVKSGNVDVSVSDTNIGLGGYLMKTFGEKTRMYGNLFFDMHLFDIQRNQTFVNQIEGRGDAFSVISEWGLMHDWLNQYVVGNVYARVGYNSGFSVTERSGGQDYMELQSNDYLVLTPGYSLIAQKRIYTSPWFQVRPYLSVGIEYDVLGAPNFAEYKFAAASRFTQYDLDLDPLWVNGGGGIEFLSASGFQMGIDYRYQYNNVIQLHNIKAALSYRF